MWVEWNRPSQKVRDENRRGDTGGKTKRVLRNSLFKITTASRNNYNNYNFVTLLVRLHWIHPRVHAMCSNTLKHKTDHLTQLYLGNQPDTVKMNLLIYLYWFTDTCVKDAGPSVLLRVHTQTIFFRPHIFMCFWNVLALTSFTYNHVTCHP